MKTGNQKYIPCIDIAKEVKRRLAVLREKVEELLKKIEESKMSNRQYHATVSELGENLFEANISYCYRNSFGKYCSIWTQKFTKWEEAHITLNEAIKREIPICERYETEIEDYKESNNE